MITHLISLTMLALVCGFLWHNRPAREAAVVDHERGGDEERPANRSAS